MKKWWKGIALLLALRESFFPDFAAWGSQVSEVITETTVTEEYWTEEFTGTREETEEWLAERKNDRQEQAESARETGEKAAEIVEEPVYEEVAEVLTPDENIYIPEKHENEEEASAEPEPKKDELPPVIQIADPLPFVSSSVPVEPEIVVSDENIARGNIFIRLLREGKEEIPFEAAYEQEENRIICRMSSIAEDGKYLLTVEAEDAAGNQSGVRCVFTVNSAGTRFAYDKKKKYVVREDNFSPEIRIENYDDVKILSCMINGREVKYRWAKDVVLIAPETICAGRNVIAIVAEDGAGNVSSMEPWEIICGE
ncbi:MAG: hypothetical protein ACOX8E_05655 [Ruminococcus sp.]|jgi:hypothetical protein